MANLNELLMHQNLEAHKNAILSTMKRNLQESLRQYVHFSNLQKNLQSNSNCPNLPPLQGEESAESLSLRGEFIYNEFKHEGIQLLALFDQFAGVLCDNSIGSIIETPKSVESKTFNSEKIMITKAELPSFDGFPSDDIFENRSIKEEFADSITLKQEERQTIKTEEAQLPEPGTKESRHLKKISKVDRMKFKGFKPKSDISDTKESINYNYEADSQKTSRKRLKNRTSKLLKDRMANALRIDEAENQKFDLTEALQEYIKTNPIRKTTSRAKPYKNGEFILEYLQKHNLLKTSAESEMQSDS